MYIETNNKLIMTNSNKNPYTTLKLIEDLRKEVAILVPKEIFHGELAYWKLCKYLGLAYGKRSDGRYWNKINDIKKTIKKVNPNYKLSLNVLNVVKENLSENFGKKASNCLKLIKKYKLTNPDLKEYSGQQWHLFNPDLKAHYFDIIDTLEKSYWLGFLRADASLQAGTFNPTPSDQNDGKSVRYRYTLSIEISKKDKILLKQFCNNIGINPKKIKERIRKKFGKRYPHVYISLDCKPIAKALERFGFSGSKIANIYLPKFSDVSGGPSTKQLFLAYLRGFYDGDGWSKRTTIGAANKQFLVRIKNRLKLPFSVRRIKTSRSYIDDSYKFHIIKSFYALTLGVKIYDEMTKIFKDNNLFYLKRKTKK